MIARYDRAECNSGKQTSRGNARLGIGDGTPPLAVAVISPSRFLIAVQCRSFQHALTPSPLPASPIASGTVPPRALSSDTPTPCSLFCSLNGGRGSGSKWACGTRSPGAHLNGCPTAYPGLGEIMVDMSSPIAPQMALPSSHPQPHLQGSHKGLVSVLSAPRRQHCFLSPLRHRPIAFLLQPEWDPASSALVRQWPVLSRGR